MSTASTLVAALERLSRSEAIDDLLRNTHIGPAGGVALADAMRGTAPAAISTLDLYACGLTDRGAAAVLHMLLEQPGCTQLDLGANSLSHAAAAALAPLLQPDSAALSSQEDEQRTGIATLRLARNAIERAALTSMLSPARANMGLLSLEVLALSFNPLGEGGGAHLGTVLGQGRLPFLTTLQLQGCALSADGAVGVAKGLAAARRVRHVDLSDNGIGDDGGASIALELPSSRLEELLLARNRLGEVAGRALATCLGKWGKRCTLKLLCLASNALRDEAACELAAVLGAPNAAATGANRSLESVDLSGNKLSHVALLALGDAAVANARLTSIDLRRNKRIDGDGLAALATLTRHNHAVRSGRTPPPLVAPTDAAILATSRKVRSLFSGAATEDWQRMPSLALGRQAVAPLASGNITEAARDAASWESHEIAQLGAQLEAKHAEIEVAAREVARLRQKEAALSQLLLHEEQENRRGGSTAAANILSSMRII